MSLVCLWTLSAILSSQRLRTDGTWGVCLADEHGLNHCVQSLRADSVM